MLGPARPVLRNTRVQAAIFHHGPADVHVADHFTMDGNVLTNHKPEQGKIFFYNNADKNNH
jgi:hypothetical protein